MSMYWKNQNDIRCHPVIYCSRTQRFFVDARLKSGVNDQPYVTVPPLKDIYCSLSFDTGQENDFCISSTRNDNQD